MSFREYRKIPLESMFCLIKNLILHSQQFSRAPNAYLIQLIETLLGSLISMSTKPWNFFPSVTRMFASIFNVASISHSFPISCIQFHFFVNEVKLLMVSYFLVLHNNEHIELIQRKNSKFNSTFIIFFISRLELLFLPLQWFFGVCCSSIPSGSHRRIIQENNYQGSYLQLCFYSMITKLELPKMKIETHIHIHQDLKPQDLLGEIELGIELHDSNKGSDYLSIRVFRFNNEFIMLEKMLKQIDPLDMRLMGKQGTFHTLKEARKMTIRIMLGVLHFDHLHIKIKLSQQLLACFHHSSIIIGYYFHSTQDKWWAVIKCMKTSGGKDTLQKLLCVASKFRS